MKNGQSHPAPQTGFTLLEVLIALLVLSIGLLGLAGLQVQGLKYNHDAYVRSQGTYLAYDMFERMRLNAANADSYVGGKPLAGCGGGGSLAENDRACWFEDLEALLPGGDATISTDGGSPAQYTLTITWTDRFSGDTITQSWTSVITP